MKQLDEPVLLQRLAEGDKTAFSELYYIYSPQLLAWINKKVDSLDDARDVLHEVFMHAWINREYIQIPKAYLFFTARNKVIDHIRRNSTRTNYANLIQRLDEPAYFDLDAALEAKDMREILEKALDELPPRTKELFRMSRNEHLSITEIAQKMDLSEQTVKNQLSSALGHLRKVVSRLSLFFSIYLLLK